MEMDTRDIPIETVVGGAVTLECDFGASNPAPVVQWFGNGTVIPEDRANGNAILYLDGGRYLYIRALTAAQRTMRYHCEVTNFRDDNDFSMRAPTTYTLDTDLANVGLTVYKDLGTQVGTVGLQLEFVYVAVNLDADGNFTFIGLSCPSNSLVTLGITSSYIVTATLQSPAEEMSQVQFNCQVQVFENSTSSVPITGTIIVSSEF